MTEAFSEHEPPDERPPVRELTKAQRRVLGVLVEKAFTTPEYYPLTLKAVVSGCNQKSNRDPVTSFNEDQALEALDSLRELGLIAVVHTESGRTERYRHYMRRRYPFSEPQLAILTELLLRGRQSPGELRTRAGRMVPIDSLEQLRDELAGLIEQGYVQTNGPLERRGVEIDHTFYPASEGRSPLREERSAPMAAAPAGHSDAARREHAAMPPAVSALASTPSPDGGVQQAIEELRRENRELRQELEAVRDDVRRLDDRVDELRRSLGG